MLLKIVYWASTIIAALMLLFALSYLTGSPEIVEGFKHAPIPKLDTNRAHCASLISTSAIRFSPII